MNIYYFQKKIFGKDYLKNNNVLNSYIKNRKEINLNLFEEIIKSYNEKNININISNKIEEDIYILLLKKDIKNLK